MCYYFPETLDTVHCNISGDNFGRRAILQGSTLRGCRNNSRTFPANCHCVLDLREYETNLFGVHCHPRYIVSAPATHEVRHLLLRIRSIAHKILALHRPRVEKKHGHDMFTKPIAPANRSMISAFKVESKKPKRWYSTVIVVFCISLPYILLFLRFRHQQDGSGEVATEKTAVKAAQKDAKPNPESCDLSMTESNGFFCEPDLVWRRRRTIFARQEMKQISNQYSPGGSSGHAKFSKHLSNWWQQNYEVGSSSP